METEQEARERRQRVAVAALTVRLSTAERLAGDCADVREASRSVETVRSHHDYRRSAALMSKIIADARLASLTPPSAIISEWSVRQLAALEWGDGIAWVLDESTHEGVLRIPVEATSDAVLIATVQEPLRDWMTRQTIGYLDGFEYVRLQQRGPGLIGTYMTDAEIADATRDVKERDRRTRVRVFRGFVWDYDRKKRTGLLRVPASAGFADEQMLHAELAKQGLMVDSSDNFWHYLGGYEYLRLVPLAD